MSLETVSITRGPDGSFAITSYLGVTVCEKRETMMQVLNAVLDSQDAYYAESAKPVTYSREDIYFDRD